MRAKRLIAAIVAGALLLAFSFGGALAAERKVRLKVMGMHCAKDEFIMGGILDPIEGIKGYTIDLDNRIAVVTFDDEVTSLDEIRATIDENVYAVEEADFIEE